MKKLVLIYCQLLFSAMVFSQKLKATVNDLSFMSGAWKQQHEWGDMEEYWGPPMGDNMICCYRCVKDGKIVFYEFVVIEQTGDLPVMKLRHFKPGNIAGEDKDKPQEFPLIDLKNNEATFGAVDHSLLMTYTRTSPKTMHILLKEKVAGGHWENTEFNYHL